MERNSNKQVSHVYKIKFNTLYNDNLVGVEFSKFHHIEHLKKKQQQQKINLISVNKFNLQLSIVHMSKTYISFALLNS